MNYKVEYLDLAKQDVADIKEYLSQFYPATPTKFLSALKQAAESLCDNPFVYAVYEDNPAYRRMVVEDYLVFYKVFEAESIIEIHRILHGMRNVNDHLPHNK